MANTYVVIDLETTGLDNTCDEIIEVAAVKVKRGLIVDQFSSLINIDLPLSAEISSLTGITDDMLEGQPKITDILPRLAEFIGEADIVAHNAEFDRSFLQRYWPDERSWIDSIILAQITYPCEPSYALAWLTKALGINNNNAHRALSDALATAELFINIEKKLTAFPDFLKEELSSLCNGDTSALADFIRKCSGKRGNSTPPADNQSQRGGYQKREINEEYVLDIDSLAQYIGEDALFKDRIPGFEARPQQLLLAQEVGKTLNNGGCLLAEAGTGTGKSLAYLLPAVEYALGSGKQVAVSTHTRNLQEQLWHKDIPMLSRLLDKPVKAAVLKGRSNYLCKRLYKYFATEPTDDLRYFLLRVAVWRYCSQEGEKGELSLNAFSRRFWQRICASRENCAPFCPYRQKNSCCVQKARIKAAEADIIIVNHSLLIANAANEGGLLPELPYLIIDEAQHLEHATEDQLTQNIDFFDILNLLSRFERSERGKRVGVIPALEKSQTDLFDTFTSERILSLTEKLAGNVEAVLQSAEKFYQVLDEFFRNERDKQSFLPIKIRIMPEHRDATSWQLILQLGEELAAALNLLSATGFSILDIASANNADDDARPALPKGCEELFGLANTARELAGTITACINEDDHNLVSWVEYSDLERKPSINIAPIELNELLRDLLYEKTEALIMTSATIGVGRDFSYFKQRNGLDLLPLPPRELTLPSPFYYRDQALFTIVNDLPDWSRCSEIEAVEAISAALIKLLTASRGRAIVLFTSHSQLKNVYRKIAEPLHKAGISVLAHGVSGAPSMLLERLKSEDNCCILGAASFWEGVDVIGEALSLIVVVRLPFWPPNTPLAATRMERIEAEGKSSFWDYSLPMALIRFKQGFGRLIRSDKDSGIFCVLDKRILEKRYGATFIRALPEMRRISGDTDTIAEEIKKWLR